MHLCIYIHRPGPINLSSSYNFPTWSISLHTPLQRQWTALTNSKRASQLRRLKESAKRRGNLGNIDITIIPTVKNGRQIEIAIEIATDTTTEATVRMTATSPMRMMDIDINGRGILKMAKTSAIVIGKIRDANISHIAMTKGTMTANATQRDALTRKPTTSRRTYHYPMRR